MRGRSTNRGPEGAKVKDGGWTLLGRWMQLGLTGRMFLLVVVALLPALAIRRDLIARRNYLVPNSIVVTRGCPQHCDFCYKDAFFEGGRSFYTQRVDDALKIQKPTPDDAIVLRPAEKKEA